MSTSVSWPVDKYATATLTSDQTTPPLARREHTEDEMARYIPSDETAETIAFQWLRDRCEQQLNDKGIVATVSGGMAADGSWAIHLRAEHGEFDFASYLDVPQLDGRVWIETDLGPGPDVDFGDPLQPSRFYDEHGR
jgi:hypothetical protein